MENVISILMNRDGISKKEAETIVNECKSRLEHEAIATGSYENAVDIIAEELGLEPDYMPELLSGFDKKGGDNMSTKLMRANRVAVKVNGDNFVADFYKTHKLIGSIHSENTDWKPTEDTNKTALRESYRQWVIANCNDWNIDWKPEDMRDKDNIRRAKYDSDEVLIDDATSMLVNEMKKLVDKCKYKIEYVGITHEDIFPVNKTCTGRDLSTMGIIDGKYKSGNWAWADIKFALTFKYKNEECYTIVTMKLVSGQLKKVGIGITDFNEIVRSEIINSGLATEQELDNKDTKVDTEKSDTKKKTTTRKPKKEIAKEEVKEEVPGEEVKPKRRRKSKKVDEVVENN